ncbi:MAG: amino acid ABC transporter permease [Alphaproteobacteria bacterium]|nr:amino acid ABC transporter permease [Alphaproteobacteria bacterium]
MTYSFTLRTIFPYLGTLGDAAATTLLISVLAILLSLALGAVFAVMRQSKSRALRGLGAAYVEFMRNTPLLVILYFVYFVVPTLGLRLSSFSSALIALALNSGAYMTEILRAGLIAVPHGQFEAAASQGMTTWQTLRHVVFPQVFRTIYAPLGNQFIAVILASSLASVIAVEDVASWMQTVGATSFRFFETFLVAAAVYLVMCQSVNLARIGIGRWLFRAARAS